MQIDTTRRGIAIFSHEVERARGALQNAKDFLKRFARIPIFICKSSLMDIKEFHLDLCQTMHLSSCEMQIYLFIFLHLSLCQLQMTPGATKKVWIP